MAGHLRSEEKCRLFNTAARITFCRQKITAEQVKRSTESLNHFGLRPFCFYKIAKPISLRFNEVILRNWKIIY